MRWAIPGRPLLTYAIGDLVETKDGLRGIVLKRYGASPVTVLLHTASGEDIECKEHYIKKAWRSKD